jgi:hypothetical protein
MFNELQVGTFIIHLFSFLALLRLYQPLEPYGCHKKRAFRILPGVKKTA